MMKLKPLPYDYEDLEPIISKEAMIEHHLKHHQGYVDKFNQTLKSYPSLLDSVGGLYALLASPKYIPQEIKDKVIDFGGGVYTHNLFWDSISPVNTEPYFKGFFKADVDKTFGSIYDLKKELIEVGKSHFGSGWVWLVITKENKLRVMSLDNQQTPLMRGHFPLLCIDLWEHAYYLDFKSERATFLNAIMSKVNWANVQYRYELFNAL